MAKKKEKIYDEVGYWTTQLESLELNGQCKHSFSVSFTVNQKIKYCKDMLVTIESEKSL